MYEPLIQIVQNIYMTGHYLVFPQDFKTSKVSKYLSICTVKTSWKYKSNELLSPSGVLLP